MKRAGVVVVLVVALVACHRAAPAAKKQTSYPYFLQFSRLGTKLGPDGVVTEEATTFDVGQPVHLTLKLHESPPGLQTRAIWTDEKANVVQKDLKNMHGGKVATFTVKTPLQPGRYHVEAYWGGNLAADKYFDVVAKGKG